MQETVSPSFTLTSFIYVNASKEELAETAKSGDELYWNIRGAGIPQIALKLSSTTAADNKLKTNLFLVTLLALIFWTLWDIKVYFLPFVRIFIFYPYKGFFYEKVCQMLSSWPEPSSIATRCESL